MNVADRPQALPRAPTASTAGLTLVEILVVLVIIVAVMTTLVAGLGAHRERGRQAAAQTHSAAVYAALREAEAASGYSGATGASGDCTAAAHFAPGRIAGYDPNFPGWRAAPTGVGCTFTAAGVRVRSHTVTATYQGRSFVNGSAQ